MGQRDPRMKAWYSQEEFRGSLMAMANVVGCTLGALHAAIAWGEEGVPIPEECLARMRQRYQESVQRLKDLMPALADEIEAFVKSQERK